MFLRGIYTNSNKSSLSGETLYQISYSLEDAFSYGVVRDKTDEIISGMERGRHFNSPLDIIKYAYSSRRYDELKKLGEKARKKEVNFYTMEEHDVKMPFMTVNTLTISAESVIKIGQETSWEVLIMGDTLESIEFRDELESMAKRYNELMDYIYETYATDLKRLLGLVASGVSASKKHLENILSIENNEEYNEIIGFLMKYVEFYEYLKNEEEVYLFV